jgi:hypothetical protein
VWCCFRLYVDYRVVFRDARYGNKALEMCNHLSVTRAQGETHKRRVEMFRRLLVICLLLFSLFSVSASAAEACTILTATQDDSVFFGNNEDYSNPDTYYWVVPSGNGTYGGVFFGFDDLWPQGGVNEMGLAFDINALPEAPLNPHPELPGLYDYEGYIALKNCATVDEAVELLSGYNWGEAMWGQIHLADAKGDAVVISAGLDGELSFTRKEKGDGALVSTNFNLAFTPDDERTGLCWRYDEAVELLEACGDGGLTSEFVRDVLDAVHVEGAYSDTLYSSVFDLRNGVINVYYFHQYDEAVRLVVADELARASEPVPLRELFSETTVERASEEQSRYVLQDKIGTILEISSAVAVIVCGYVLFRRVRSRQ